MWAALYGGQTKSGRRRSLHRLLHGRQRSKLQRAGDDARRPHRPASLPRTHAVRHKQRDRAAPDTPQLPPDHQGKQAHGGVSRALDRPALPASMYAGERTWADVQRYIGACGTPGTPVATLRLGKTYHQVTAQDVRTLMPGKWVNDECLNLYFGLVQARWARQAAGGAARLRSYVLSTFFWTQLTLGSSGFNYAGVRRWTRSDRTHTDGACVLTWDLILAPINLGPNSHWALAAIWPRKGLLQYYDSLHLSGSHVLKQLGRWLLLDCEDKGVPMPPQPLQYADVTSGVPKQTDSSSCGVMMAAMCERLAAGAGAPFSFDQADVGRLRLGMAVDLLSQRL